jgi:signal transduction histidine kinase
VAGTELTQILLAAAQRLAESIDPEHVYDSFHELLGEVVPHDGVVVSSFAADEGLIRCEYAWVEGARVDESTLPVLPLNREGGGMQSRVIVTGEPLLVNDVAERVQEPGGTYYNVDREGRVAKIPETGPSGTTAAMMVPVKHGGDVVGVVQLMRDRGVYSQRDLELFSALVGLMQAAVRNARLQAERAQLEAVAAVDRARADEQEQAARVLEVVGDGIILVDRDGVIVFSNRAADAVTGVELCGRRAGDVFGAWESVEAAVPIARDVGAASSMTLPVSVDDRELVATISHELRTPMTGVYGAAQTLLRTDVEWSAPQRRDLLQLIASQAERLSQIVDDLLLATNIDHDRIRIAHEPVEIGELVRQTLELLEGADIEIEAPGPSYVLGDRDRIQQIVVNLVDNALKYGWPPVRLVVASAGDVLELSVRDSGTGIPREQRERIFEKFYRADPELARAPSGTGLGLYIARALAERMGGSLDLRSVRASGAEFVLRLPKAAA